MPRMDRFRDEDIFERVLAVNVLGPFHVAKQGNAEGPAA
jgi:NAD(P)-dependent dehydrogenase (short-subunit alcohol dehydrogenase family)